MKVAKRADGKFETEIVQKVFDGAGRQLRQGVRVEVSGFPSSPLSCARVPVAGSRRRRGVAARWVPDTRPR